MYLKRIARACHQNEVETERVLAYVLGFGEFAYRARLGWRWGATQCLNAATNGRWNAGMGMGSDTDPGGAPVSPPAAKGGAAAAAAAAGDEDAEGAAAPQLGCDPNNDQGVYCLRIPPLRLRENWKHEVIETTFNGKVREQGTANTLLSCMSRFL